MKYKLNREADQKANLEWLKPSGIVIFNFISENEITLVDSGGNYIKNNTDNIHQIFLRKNKLKDKSVINERLMNIKSTYRNNIKSKVWIPNSNHKTKILLFKMINNSIPTQKTLNLRNPKLYPDSFCHACKNTIEDTYHVMFECNNLVPNKKNLKLEISKILPDAYKIVKKALTDSDRNTKPIILSGICWPAEHFEKSQSRKLVKILNKITTFVKLRW